MFDKEAVDALKQWKYTSSAAGKKKAIVQIDFMLDPVPQDIERVGVTPSK